MCKDEEIYNESTHKRENIDRKMAFYFVVYKSTKERIELVRWSQRHIGVNGPEETKQYYCSIYDVNSEVEKVNLGIIRNEKGDVHFVIVTKLGAIFSKANDKNYSHVKMCRDCGLIFKTSERLLQHYKEDHKDETMKKQVLKLPNQEDAWIRFNIDRNPDFSKTLRYFFVCYADFESSNISSLEIRRRRQEY
jgi:hypothetical protein